MGLIYFILDRNSKRFKWNYFKSFWVLKHVFGQPTPRLIIKSVDSEMLEFELDKTFYSKPEKKLERRFSFLKTTQKIK